MPSIHVAGITTTVKTTNTKVVHVTAPLVTISDINKPNVQYQISPSSTVTVNGVSASLSDIRVGDTITITGNPVTAIVIVR